MSATVRNDLSLYDRHAGEWWDPSRPFAATLHGVNALRLVHLAAVFGGDMRGVVAVDLGCGGGLLAEPMARQGATVIGLDASLASIAAAQAHGRGLPGLRYEVGDARSPALPPACADLVTCTDLLEHIAEWPEVLRAAANLLRRGGRLYVSTLNRTLTARLLAVHLAEGLRLIPPGTHDPAMFIRPAELVTAAAEAGLRHERLLGQSLRLWPTLRTWSIRLAEGGSTAMGYGAWFRKEGA